MAPSLFRTVLLLSALTSLITAETSSPLRKRTSLLSPRQRSCINPSYIPVCPGAFPCVPPGALCCSDGLHFALPPETCPDGTSPVATAVTSAAAPPSSTITAAPTFSTVTIAEYSWYTYTITYFYYYYYYTYVGVTLDLTSTGTTFYTTVSFTATDDFQASSLVEELSSTIEEELSTAQTATSTLGAVPVATETPSETPTATATSTEVEEKTTTASASKTIPAPTGNATKPTTAAPTQFTGAAVAVGRVHGGVVWWITLLGAGMWMVGSGVLMVVL